MNHKKYVSNNIILQLCFVVLILLVFGLIFNNILSFLPGILSAICLYVLLLEPLKWLTEVKKWNKFLSVILLLFCCVILIIIPIYVLIHVSMNKVMLILNDNNTIEIQIKKLIDVLIFEYKIDIFSEANISKLTKLATTTLQAILNLSMQMLLQLGVAFLLLYFMLLNANNIEASFYKYIPFKNQKVRTMNGELRRLVISNAIGVPLTAVCQAFIAYIGYLIFGVSDPFTWFIFTIFVSMLPIFGTALIYVPISIVFFIEGQLTQAIGLLLYGIFIIGLSDNLIRFLLQKRIANIHPLVTIFGVVIGINLFGVIGIIFGPILFSVFLWLLKLYKAEFVDPNPEDKINHKKTKNEH